MNRIWCLVMLCAIAAFAFVGCERPEEAFAQTTAEVQSADDATVSTQADADQEADSSESPDNTPETEEPQFEDVIVGTWEFEEIPEVTVSFTFNNDRTLGAVFGEITATGTWSFDGESRILALHFPESNARRHFRVLAYNLDMVQLEYAFAPPGGPLPPPLIWERTSN